MTRPTPYRRLAYCICGRKPRWRWLRLDKDWMLRISCICGRRLSARPISRTSHNVNTIIRQWNKLANNQQANNQAWPKKGPRSIPRRNWN